MTVHSFPKSADATAENAVSQNTAGRVPDSLYRLLRQQQFADHDARKFELVRKNASRSLSADAALVRRGPRFSE